MNHKLKNFKKTIYGAKRLKNAERAFKDHIDPFVFHTFKPHLISKKTYGQLTKILAWNLDAFRVALTPKSFTKKGDQPFGVEHLLTLKSHCHIYKMTFHTQYPEIRHLRPLPYMIGHSIIWILSRHLEASQYNPPKYLKTLAGDIGRIRYPHSVYHIDRHYHHVYKATTRDVETELAKVKRFLS